MSRTTTAAPPSELCTTTATTSIVQLRSVQHIDCRTSMNQEQQHPKRLEAAPTWLKNSARAAVTRGCTAPSSSFMLSSFPGPSTCVDSTARSTAPAYVRCLLPHHASTIQQQGMCRLRPLVDALTTDVCMAYMLTRLTGLLMTLQMYACGSGALPIPPWAVWPKAACK